MTQSLGDVMLLEIASTTMKAALRLQQEAKANSNAIVEGAADRIIKELASVARELTR